MFAHRRAFQDREIERQIDEKRIYKGKQLDPATARVRVTAALFWMNEF